MVYVTKRATLSFLISDRGQRKKKQGGSTTNLDPETDVTIGTNNSHTTLTVAQFRKQ